MKDPLTIRKITCKSTGLPVSRVRDIKKALREVYRRAVEEGVRSNCNHIPAKEQFEKGVRVWDCLTFEDHLDIMDFHEWCDAAFSTEGAAQ